MSRRSTPRRAATRPPPPASATSPQGAKEEEAFLWPRQREAKEREAQEARARKGPRDELERTTSSRSHPRNAHRAEDLTPVSTRYREISEEDDSSTDYEPILDGAYEDEDVEASPKALEKEEISRILARLKELGYTHGPQAKVTLVPKPRKGNPHHNKVIPTHVGAPDAPKHLGIPSQRRVSGPFRKELPPQFAWGDKKPFEPKEDSPTKAGPSPRPRTLRADTEHRERRSEMAPEEKELEKQRSRVAEFFASVKGPMTEYWPEVALPEVTDNVFEALVDELPVEVRTPAPSHFKVKPDWQRWSFLMDTRDFELRHFRILLILDRERQHNLHYESNLKLSDAPTGVGLQADADIYMQRTRSFGDLSNTPTVLTLTEFNQWEHVPVLLLRRRPVRILFDWIYDGIEGFWSLPLRMNPFPSDDRSAHPE